MGPRVKFTVDEADILAMKTRLLSNDVKEADKLGYMIFKLGDEAWIKVDQGPCRADLATYLYNKCAAENTGKHLIFRSLDNSTDVWIKYIPDDAHVKERTCFASGSESLMDGAGLSCKNKLECRDLSDLKDALARFL